MADLKALIEAVEAGTAKGEDFNVAPSVGWFGHSEMDAYRAYHGSMDDALALFKELLPGWTWAREKLSGQMSVWPPVGQYLDGAKVVEIDNPEPARALLLATLKAVEAQK